MAGLFGVLVGLQWYGMNEMERVGKITKQYRFGARVFEPEMNFVQIDFGVRRMLWVHGRIYV